MKEKAEAWTNVHNLEHTLHQFWRSDDRCVEMSKCNCVSRRAVANSELLLLVGAGSEGSAGSAAFVPKP